MKAKIISLGLIIPLVIGGKTIFDKYRNYRADIYQTCSDKQAELIRNREIYENGLSDQKRAKYRKLGIKLPEGNLYKRETILIGDYNPKGKEMHPCDWIEHNYGRITRATGSGYS